MILDALYMLLLPSYHHLRFSTNQRSTGARSGRSFGLINRPKHRLKLLRPNSQESVESVKPELQPKSRSSGFFWPCWWIHGASRGCSGGGRSSGSFCRSTGRSRSSGLNRCFGNRHVLRYLIWPELRNRPKRKFPASVDLWHKYNLISNGTISDPILHSMFL